jgi:uncharacterized protein (TIGR02270 family)
MSEITQYEGFTAAEISAGKIAVIVDQHASEAAFLWLLRDAAVRAPHYALKDLARLDERVEAHLDGLRVASDFGWKICVEALEEGAAGEVFAASSLAFDIGKDEHIQMVIKAGAATVEKSRGLVSALGWLSYDKAEKFIRRFLEAEAPAVRGVGIAASAIHRQNPRRPLEQALTDADARLRARALRAVSELGLVDLLPTVRKNLSHEDRNCRFWAAWCLALASSDKDAITQLQAVAESDSPYRERAVQIATRRLDPSAAKMWQRKLSQNPKQIRLAIISAGALGDPEAVPSLIERMKNPPLARIAGEAFTMITGVDIAYQDLDTDKPEDFEAGPTEKPEDAGVAMDADEHLPWPNPEAIQKWWTAHQGEFSKGTRYLVGKPITPEWLYQVLREGRQRQRAAAALELALRQRGSKLFEVRAPGFRQQKILAEIAKQD